MNAQSATSMPRVHNKTGNYRKMAFWAIIGAVVVLFLLLVFGCWDVLVAQYMLVS
jgi:hypothetical protein